MKDEVKRMDEKVSIPVCSGRCGNPDVCKNLEYCNIKIDASTCEREEYCAGLGKCERDE